MANHLSLKTRREDKSKIKITGVGNHPYKGETTMEEYQILTVMGILWLIILIIKLSEKIKTKQKEDRKRGIYKHWWEY